MIDRNNTSPVDLLLIMGDPRKSREWDNYLELGLGPEHTPELILLATDENLHQADPESEEVWAALHAWRALGQLRAEEAVEPLLQLLHKYEDDDWLGSELPIVFGMIGPAAIPALIAYAADEPHGLYPRTHAIEGLTKIGENHPDYREECVAAMIRQLESFEEQDEVFNAFIISSLMDLNAVESAPVMERVFAADMVDTTIAGDWDDVQVELGLKEPGPRQLQRAALLASFNRSLASTPSPRESNLPSRNRAKAKAKRKQAKKSRKKSRRR